MIFADLLDALAGAPALPGAACKGWPDPFDPPATGEPSPEVDYRHRVALTICEACPALADCGRWLDSLRPRDRPRGVIAGRVIHPPRQRLTKAS